ncbi:hypothetical protein [Pseudoalteromonas luteoviolacea]|uniref:hypothetical protein n=1 Tax=Pseudoalteromonas luteoviolacea TaxID=43657 RepID=UPI001150D2B2|nr:hypothetical protein [Pseudoalteromonas luteoviolacea]TQF71308.1 hypothetical protein FLM44_09510 [Pseudoalteromonas luteoviolacea]
MIEIVIIIIMLGIALFFSADFTSLVRPEIQPDEILTEYLTIYSPAMTSSLDIHSEVINFKLITFVLISSLVFIFYKHKEHQKTLKLSHKIFFVGFVCALFLYQIATYGSHYEEIHSDYVNYENINNFHKVKTFEAKLISTEILRETWPGNKTKRGDDGLWTILKLNTSKGEFHINTQADWLRSQDHTMPLCFKGDFIQLITPYEGRDIKMRYYHSFSTYHETDKSKTVCLVDFKVK